MSNGSTKLISFGIANFPGVVGAIDGTQVRIVAPTETLRNTCRVVQRISLSIRDVVLLEY